MKSFIVKFFIVEFFIFPLLLIAMTSCTNPSEKPAPPAPPAPEKTETLTLGAGCFWCVEAVYDRLPGVLSTTSGYMGGHLENPTYEQVCTGTTGHAEVVQVVFDPAKTSASKILDAFWQLHDPTQRDGQGADKGPQYRSSIFYHSEAQKTAAEASKAATQEKHPKPIATEITPASAFHPAEDSHQNYYDLNKRENPYCPRVIAPKLRKMGLEE